MVARVLAVVVDGPPPHSSPLHSPPIPAVRRTARGPNSSRFCGKCEQFLVLAGGRPKMRLLGASDGTWRQRWSGQSRPLHRAPPPQPSGRLGRHPSCRPDRRPSHRSRNRRSTRPGACRQSGSRRRPVGRRRCVGRPVRVGHIYKRCWPDRPRPGHETGGRLRASRYTWFATAGTRRLPGGQRRRLRQPAGRERAKSSRSRGGGRRWRPPPPVEERWDGGGRVPPGASRRRGAGPPPGRCARCRPRSGPGSGGSTREPGPR